MSLDSNIVNSSAAESLDAGRALSEPHNPTITSCDDRPLKSATKTHDAPAKSSPQRNKDMHSDSCETPAQKSITLMVEELSCSVSSMALEASKETNDMSGTSSSGRCTDDSYNNAVEIGTSEFATSAPVLKVEASSSPVIVVSTSPMSSEKHTQLPTLVDDPDPKLVDALRNPRDRPFLLKLEQEVISFITGNTLESFDTSPINSYYRMLVHKVAEFYRLTHIVSPVAIDSVRLIRGNAARIPPMRLAEITISKAASDTPSSNSQQSVKIMRRKSPSDKSDSPPDQSGCSKTDTPAMDSSKALTREEKEAAYQLARARIFGDFKESPPDTPSPSKTPSEKATPQRKIKEDDGFQSRSQFFPVPPPNPKFPPYENPTNRYPTIPHTTPGYFSPPPNQSPQHLNPTANVFNPNAGAFIPGRQPMVTPPIIPQFPHPYASSNGYSQHQPPQAYNSSFQNPQLGFNRSMLPPNISSSNTPPITRLPSSSHPGYMVSPVQQTRFPTTGAFTPPLNNHHRPFHPHPVNSFSYANQHSHIGHMNGPLNGNFNGNITGPINGGWPGHSVVPLQHGTIPQSDGSFLNGYHGVMGGYGVGRS